MVSFYEFIRDKTVYTSYACDFIIIIKLLIERRLKDLTGPST